jgi:hypothetical protein
MANLTDKITTTGVVTQLEFDTAVDWTLKTTTYTAVSRESIVADTSGGAWTLTLPATPVIGNSVKLIDGGDWSVNNLTVGRNGQTIVGSATDLTVNISGAVDLIFDGTTWQVTAQIGGNGDGVTLAGTDTLTNKTIDLSSNTISGTTAQFNTSLTDDDFTTLTGTETLTNKTLTGVILDGIPTAPTATAGTDTTQVATTAQVRLAIPDVLSAAGTAPVYACRAWVNIQGTGTVAIRGSGNVSSITDNGLGDYTVIFTTAMQDASYAPTLTYTNEVNVAHGVGFIESVFAGSFRVRHFNTTNSANSVDKAIVGVAVFR